MTTKSTPVVLDSFEHKSPVSTRPCDPLVALGSNCIRDYFGTTVQMVAGCLHMYGGWCTLQQILTTLRLSVQRKVWSKERTRLMRWLEGSSPSSVLAPIRASLLILLQHSIVTVRINNSKKYEYQLDMERARLLPRYPRYVEYSRKALDDMAAALIEQLLVQGRMRTVDAVVSTVEHLGQLEDTPVRSDAYRYTHTTRQAVLESFRRLVEGGFIQQAPVIDNQEIINAFDETTGNDTAKKEDQEPPKKKVKIAVEDQSDRESQAYAQAKITEIAQEDPAVVALLQSGSFKLPRDAVWRVNVHMFHETWRAFCLGQLVADRYGNKVQSCGSMVSAALKFIAYKRHGEKISNQDTDSGVNICFEPGRIVNFLPQAIRDLLNNKSGGILPNLANGLSQLSKFKSPKPVRVGDEGGRPEQSTFEIATRNLVIYLQDRAIHQAVHDNHGEVAARICSILSIKGYLESDTVAEEAMVPAKETREVLYRLFRSGYVQLMNLQPNSRQHNPAAMIYLWGVDRARIAKNVTDKVCTALFNLRLRRQHEVEVIGKNFMDRAARADDEENDNIADQKNRQKFEIGLERLDNATLQLDETLMVLKDF